MTATGTISELERDLQRMWVDAHHNGIPPNKVETALLEMGGINPRDVTDHVGRLSRLAGPDYAVGWWEGLRTGVWAGLRTAVTDTRQRHTRRAGTLAMATGLVAWLVACWAAAAWLLALLARELW